MREKSHILKNYWFWVAVILLIGISFYLKVDIKSPINSNSRLTISFANGQERAFEGQVDSDTTLLLALYASSMGGGFSINYSINKDGNVSLSSIAGVANTSTQSWHFYLNSMPVSVSDINKIKVKPGDQINVKYE